MKRWRITKEIKYSGIRVTPGAVIETDDVAWIGRYKALNAIEPFEQKPHPETKVAETNVEMAVRPSPARRGRKRKAVNANH